ncbi:MAG: PQQ-dependent sugar dehydrogenase, partial [Pseudomonadota bacterium]
MRKPLFLILNVLFSYSLLLTSTSIANAQKWQHQTEKGPVVVEKIAGDLDTPWAMAMLPNGNLLVTLRDGKLVLVDRQNAKQISIKGTPRVWAQGQGGLLDVVLDPNFAENNLIYLSFSDPDSSGNAGTAIARARLVGADGVSPRLADYQKLYSMRKKTNRGQHFGSRIVPDKKGNLFFTIGDRGNRPRAQDPFDAAGKVMRIRTDGSIPANNPFADGKDALPEIWSIGHRNPQGATLNDLTGEIWTLAHGPKGGDEINIPQAGKNYGWP